MYKRIQNYQKPFWPHVIKHNKLRNSSNACYNVTQPAHVYIKSQCILWITKHNIVHCIYTYEWDTVATKFIRKVIRRNSKVKIKINTNEHVYNTTNCTACTPVYQKSMLCMDSHIL